MPTPSTPRRPGAPPIRAAVAIGTLLAAALFLFPHLPPIFLWDESRNIVNALEMDQRGLGLVTTYGGAPDLWNTKPPLLIWLMVASVRLFGASLWALRLPGMMATLGTIAIVMAFVRRQTGSIATAAFAAALLAGSPALFGEHGARTADYDSLLVFFVTGYLVLLFDTLHRDRAAPLPLAGAACCIVGAVMTKSVAGVMPGLGVGAYLILAGRLGRLLDWRYAAAGVAVAGTILLFLLAREQASPGYWAASWYNDMGGRFAQSLVGARKPVTFYPAILWAGYFAATPLLMVAPFVLPDAGGRSRAALRYALVVVVTLLVTATLAASKLHHYLLPVMPFMAVAAAIVARTILSMVRRTHGARTLALAAVALVSITVAAERAVLHRWIARPPYEGAQSGRYGALFAGLEHEARPIVAIDPGFADHGDPHYAPVLDAYRLLADAHGQRIVRWTAPGVPRTGIPIVRATCDPATASRLRREGPDIAHLPGCAAIRR